MERHSRPAEGNECSGFDHNQACATPSNVLPEAKSSRSSEVRLSLFDERSSVPQVEDCRIEPANSGCLVSVKDTMALYDTAYRLLLCLKDLARDALDCKRPDI